MDEKTIRAIEAIIQRGNDAKIRRKGKGYVVVEVKEKIEYSPPPADWGGGRAIGASYRDNPGAGSFFLQKF